MKLTEETLTEAEMTNWFETIKSFSSDHLGRAHEMLYSAIAEIRRHRSALAADGERVRGVVEQIVREEFTGKHDDATIVNADWMEIQRTIATRAAEQLATAGVGLSEDDRSELDDLLRHISDQRSIAVCDGRSGDAEALAGWRDALSRLLGASK